MVKVKICGLRRECDIDFVNEAKADFAGMIFAEGTKRCISFEQAKKMKARLDGGISAVGVFVNEPIEYMKKLVKNGVIDIIQLHGNQSDEFVQRVKIECGAPVIKAFNVKSKEDVLSAVKSSADYILFDGGTGGTGEKADFDLLKDVKREFFLAGGLNDLNVSEAVKELSPFAVDTSSGVETDGFKNKEKVNAFVKNAKGI